MTGVSAQLLELQIRLLALNGLAECARHPADQVAAHAFQQAVGLDVARRPFDIEAVHSLDFLLADGGAHQ